MEIFQQARLVVEQYLSRYDLPSPWEFGLIDSITFTAACLSILFFIVFLFRNRQTRSKLDRPSRTLLKKAKKAEKKGNFKDAGDLYMAAKSYEAAAKAFIQIWDYRKAAEACLKSDDFINAAKCLVKVEDYSKAADLFLKGKDFAQAGENLLRIGLYQDAAPLFERGSEPVKAAECYGKMGLYQKAGELLSSNGDHAKSAPYLLRALQERISRRNASVSLDEDAVARNLALLASASLIESDNKKKAAQALELGGLISNAAKLYEELGDRRRASKLYMQIKDTAAAARVMESSDHPDDGGHDIAEALLEEGKLSEAADLFTRLGEWKKAGQIYRQADMMEKAADAFRMANENRAAADILLKLSRPSEAAELLVAAGEAGEAAEIYREMGEADQEVKALEEAGLFFQVAKRLIEQGKNQAATEALQKVEENDPNFSDANRLLGELFFGQKIWPLAIASFQKALQDGDVRRDNLESYYRFAICLREDGQYQGALSILEKILMVDYHYRDVKDQLQNVKGLLATSPISPRTQPETGDVPGDVTVVQTESRQKQGRYEIIEEIGRGGMGVVYSAKDTILDRMVAYKILPPQVQRNKRVLDMFLREAKSAARLSHPNIVTIFDADRSAEEYYIIMELVEGKSLKELLEKEGKFEQKAALLLITQVLHALAYAHSRGIVHRDIKPANLLWAQEEKLVKITDFGLARVIEEGRRTHTQMAGTPYYMAPEQILGGTVDHRADLYSAGITLYEFLTGSVPFTEGDVLYHHVHTPARPPHEVDESIPPELSTIIMRCMEKDAEKRYSNIPEILEELKKVVKG